MASQPRRGRPRSGAPAPSWPSPEGSLAAVAGIPQVDDDAESAMLRKQDVITGDDIDWLKENLKTDKAMDSFKKWIQAKGIDSIESITQEQFVEIKPKVEARAKHD